MSRLHGKSVLLGMGIGIILTALLGFVFFLGYRPEMDEAKIREMARKYGMVDPGETPGRLSIEIKEADTLSKITEKLSDIGLVQDAVSFQIKMVNRKGKARINPGVYHFRGNEDEEELISILTSE